MTHIVSSPALAAIMLLLALPAKGQSLQELVNAYGAGTAARSGAAPSAPAPALPVAPDPAGRVDPAPSRKSDTAETWPPAQLPGQAEASTLGEVVRQNHRHPPEDPGTAASWEDRAAYIRALVAWHEANAPSAGRVRP